MLLKIRNLFSILFLHSFRRTFSILGAIIISTSIPISLILIKQQQDLRQHASCLSFGGISIGGDCTTDPYKNVCAGDLNNIPQVGGTYVQTLEAYEAAGLQDVGEINLKNVIKEIVLAQTVVATQALARATKVTEIPYALIIKRSDGRYYVVGPRGEMGLTLESSIYSYDEALRIANSYRTQMIMHGITPEVIGNEIKYWKGIADAANIDLATDTLLPELNTAATNLGTTYSGAYQMAIDGSGNLDRILTSINQIDQLDPTRTTRISEITVELLNGNIKTFSNFAELSTWTGETKIALEVIKANLVTREAVLSTIPLTFTAGGASKLVPLFKIAAKGGFVLDVLFEATRDGGFHGYAGCSQDRKYISGVAINTDLDTFVFNNHSAQCPSDSRCAYNSNTCVQCLKLPDTTVNTDKFAFVCDATNKNLYIRAVRDLINLPPERITCPTDNICRQLSNGIECVSGIQGPQPSDTCRGPYDSTLQFKCFSGTPDSGWTKSNDKTCDSGTCYWYSGGGGTKPTCQQVYASSTCKKDLYCTEDANNATGTSCENQGEGWVCCTPIAVSQPQMGGGSTNTYPTTTTYALPTPTPGLPSVATINALTCQDPTDPSGIIFVWTRQQSGLYYEVSWGVNGNYTEEKTYGETSQTEFIPGFTPGVVNYRIRAYLGNNIGPYAYGTLTVPSVCNSALSANRESSSVGIKIPTLPLDTKSVAINQNSCASGISCGSGCCSAGQTCNPGPPASCTGGSGGGGAQNCSQLCLAYGYTAGSCQSTSYSGEGTYIGAAGAMCTNTTSGATPSCYCYNPPAVRTPSGRLAVGSACSAYQDCDSLYCDQFHACGNAPTNPCSLATNKPLNCSCSKSSECSSQYCGQGGFRQGLICQTAVSSTVGSGNTGIAGNVTPVLTCDPVKDGVINTADYDLWLKEYTHQVNTTLTSCFVPGNATVNLLDFQVWKDISILKIKPAH